MGGLTTAKRFQQCAGRACFCFLLLWASLLVPTVHADLAIDFTVADIEGEVLAAKGIRFTLIQSDDGTARLTGQVDHLSLPHLAMTFTQLVLDCPQATIDAGGYVCEHASLRTQQGPVGAQQVTLQLRYAGADDWAIAFSGLRVAGGVVTGRFQSEAEGWQGTLQGNGLRAKHLSGLRRDWRLPAGWSVEGRLDASLALKGVAGVLQDVQLSLSGRDLAYSDADGLQAAEGLGLRTSLKARAVTGEWEGKLTASLRQGQLYSDPIFIEVSKEPIELKAGFRTRGGLDDLELTDAGLHWPAILEAKLDGRLGLRERSHRQLAITLKAPGLASLYPVLLQPLLLGTALDDVRLDGSLEVMLGVDGEGADALDVQIDDLHLDDNQARFGIAGLAGGLHWQRSDPVSPSRLTMSSGHLYAMDIGEVQAKLIAQGDELRLSSPLVIPLLEGEARLQSFTLSGLLGGQDIAWQASASLDRLSLPMLSQKLGWPIISGELNGRIPGLSYQQHVMRLGGELTAQALGGEIGITDLTLHEPLGPVPVLEMDASMQGLDLDQLTRTFSVGRITGLLNGEIQGLQLVGWQPSRFVARFYSPEGREGPRRRISQRAVENLTELGNGVAVGLSGTFLRFFEDFAYDRILLAVKLDGKNAELDGIPHSGGGYYLVRGRGLPRIDVVGRNRRVAWRDLVSRLKNIRFEGVQVQH